MPPENAKAASLTFTKRERLCSETQIAELLRNRQRIFCPPLKCHYIFLPLTEENNENQLVISVPKRFLKHAVDRNRVKRQLRETYRKNKQLLIDAATDKGLFVVVAMIWISVGQGTCWVRNNQVIFVKWVSRFIKKC